MKRKTPAKPRAKSTAPVPAPVATPELHIEPALQRAIAVVRTAIIAVLDLADRTAEAVVRRS